MRLLVPGGSVVDGPVALKLLPQGQGSNRRPWAQPRAGEPLPVPPPLPPGAEFAPGLRVLAHRRRGADLDAYDCWSEQRHSRCFVKVLRPDRLVAPPRRRLVREGRLLLSLTHPHLVRAYELLPAPAGGSPALVLETIPGVTLDQRLTGSGRMPVPDIGRLGRQLCSAVHYLHDRGYLHLDVKPGNVVGEGDHARLIDLSCARRPGKAAAGWGTSDQMAPEQASGGLLTSAADVWGVGLVLYQCATGHRPFRPEPRREGGGRARFLQLSLAAPPVRAHRRVPAAVAATLDACLAGDPGDRPTLAELDAALTNLQ